MDEGHEQANRIEDEAQRGHIPEDNHDHKRDQRDHERALSKQGEMGQHEKCLEKKVTSNESCVTSRGMAMPCPSWFRNNSPVRKAGWKVITRVLRRNAYNRSLITH